MSRGIAFSCPPLAKAGLLRYERLVGYLEKQLPTFYFVAEVFQDGARMEFNMFWYATRPVFCRFPHESECCVQILVVTGIHMEHGLATWTLNTYPKTTEVMGRLDP